MLRASEFASELSESVRNRPGKLPVQPSETVRMGIHIPIGFGRKQFGREIRSGQNNLAVI